MSLPDLVCLRNASFFGISLLRDLVVAGSLRGRHPIRISFTVDYFENGYDELLTVKPVGRLASPEATASLLRSFQGDEWIIDYCGCALLYCKSKTFVGTVHN